MATLGGIVSAHAPVKIKHKIAYAVTFAFLGGCAVVVVVQQAKATAKSEAELHNEIATLSADASKSVLLQQSNNELQKRVLDLSKLNASLAKEGIATVTGGDSYCWMNIMFLDG